MENKSSDIREIVQSVNRIRALVFTGKLIVLILVLILMGLVSLVRDGFHASPEKNWQVANQVLPIPQMVNYKITFASNGFFSKIVVLDNLKTRQRIVYNRVYFRKERKPDEFIRKYNHPGQQVRMRKSTFTGLQNPWIVSFGIRPAKYHSVPYARVQAMKNGEKIEGIIYCLYCPVTDKSWFIESSAPVGQFSESDTWALVSAAGPCH